MFDDFENSSTAFAHLILKHHLEGSGGLGIRVQSTPNEMVVESIK